MKNYKLFLLLFLLICLIPIQYLNFTNFCYSEMRYLSERDLVDSYLFGAAGKTMSEDEKTAEIKNKGGEYPNCCRVHEDFDQYSEFSRLINNLFGSHIFSVESNLPDSKHAEEKNPYRHTYSSIDSCGHNAGADSYSITEDEENYKSEIKFIEKYWKGKSK